MMAFLMVKLLAVIVSIVLGAGILARDHELKTNRLIAAFLFCNAWWAGVEFFLYQAQDVLHAERLYRAMGLGSIPLGVLCAHVSVSLSSMEDHPVGRLIGPCYVAMILLLPFSLATDWVVAGTEKTTLEESNANNQIEHARAEGAVRGSNRGAQRVRRRHRRRRAEQLHAIVDT
ncbi:MAG: hypothetical protein CL933_09590, partial [Deltaproteobacteria bacterium]|nr:hypothetical protein [Deltaproteobacteria bacterium]